MDRGGVGGTGVRDGLWGLIWELCVLFMPHPQAPSDCLDGASLLHADIDFCIF